MFASAYANGAVAKRTRAISLSIINIATAACVDILTIRNIYQVELGKESSLQCFHQVQLIVLNRERIILGMDCSDLMEIGLIQVFEKHEIKYCTFIEGD
ncbi:hypothetical protein C1645_840718 [Glomus cerebriforme]|uniref:Uncharacterized protein n=1 Tax=Glomus cerebriforme TaxID=658196 RepID=A0A397S3Y4_9GLOM|nr:hypothetical protein C1645_840718 [Glomus cerebriforme]